MADISITVEKISNPLIWIIPLVIIILILAYLIYILIKKNSSKFISIKGKTKVYVKKKEPIYPEHNAEKWLKQDEKQIVNILKQRNNKCEQGTLCVITGFSKAKLSELLTELEKRGIISKIKTGKKNIIVLNE